MTWRRAAVYWLCFLALGVYYVVVEREPAGHAVAHLTRAPFLEVPPEEIQAVELRRGNTVVRCRRGKDRWQVLEPAGARVPVDLIAALVNNLAQLPDVEVIAETAQDLGQFGLETPVSQITLTRASGPPIAVHLGARNPSGTAVYAQRSDSPRVYLIGLNVRYYEDLVFEAVKG
jgi:hypothetical protein